MLPPVSIYFADTTDVVLGQDLSLRANIAASSLNSYALQVIDWVNRPISQARANPFLSGIRLSLSCNSCKWKPNDNG